MQGFIPTHHDWFAASPLINSGKETGEAIIIGHRAQSDIMHCVNLARLRKA